MKNFRIARRHGDKPLPGPYFETLDELKQYVSACFHDEDLPPVERLSEGEWMPMDAAELA